MEVFESAVFVVLRADSFLFSTNEKKTVHCLKRVVSLKSPLSKILDQLNWFYNKANWFFCTPL